LRRAMEEGNLPRGDPEDSLDSGVSARVIDDKEAAAVRAAITARKIIIQVDEFPPEYLAKTHKYKFHRGDAKDADKFFNKNH